MAIDEGHPEGHLEGGPTAHVGWSPACHVARYDLNK
jgi:hypothetical protein